MSSRNRVILLMVFVGVVAGLIGFQVASRRSRASLTGLQQSMLEISFGGAVQAAQSESPEISAHAQRHYLSVSHAIDASGWPGRPTLLVQQIAAWGRLAIACEKLGDESGADQATREALDRCRILTKEFPEWSGGMSGVVDRASLVNHLKQLDAR